MTVEQDILELRQRLERLEQEQLAPIQASLLHLRAKFTPTGYLDIRYQPQLTGDVTHLAGTEPVLVPGISQQFVDWTADAQATHNIDATASQAVCNLSEAGRLIGVQVETTKYTVASIASSPRVRLEFAIDGVAANFIYIFDDHFRSDIGGLTTVSADLRNDQRGKSQGDAFFLPIFADYTTSLAITSNRYQGTISSGEWDVVISVVRVQMQ